MKITITLGRSDTLLENVDAPPETPEIITLGPFPYVGLTYDLLRVGPEGDVIGSFHEGAWYLTNDPVPFSDIDVYVGDRP